MTQAILKDTTQPADTACPPRDTPVVVRPPALVRFLQTQATAGTRIEVRARPWRTAAVLVASDLAALLGAVALAGWLQLLIAGQADPSWLLRFSLLPLLFLMIYASAGLYPAIPLSPPDELRRLTLITTTVYVSAVVALSLAATATHPAPWIFLSLSWGLSLVMVPLLRAVVRQIWSSRPWWGCPAVLLGGGSVTESIVRTLVRHPKIGLKPVAVIGDSHGQPSSILGVPIIGRLYRVRQYARQYRIPYAIIPMSEMRDRRTAMIIRRFSRLFKHVMIIPPITHFSSLWISPVDLGGLLGLESRYRLLDPGRQTIKRILDLTLIIIGAPLWLPCMVAIAVAIKLDSKGPAFFSQRRPGLGGKEFQIVKFRTMVNGAHDALKSCLDETPEHRKEWTRTGKLRHDPRVTLVGRFLRRTSLDELPQLWNVIRGDMSLVGPRPILYEQQEGYRNGWTLYMRVRPGITGAWQVSGRNDLTIAQRIHLDTYYVRNWSIWLDIYYLSRTASTVLRARGAY